MLPLATSEREQFQGVGRPFHKFTRQRSLRGLGLSTRERCLKRPSQTIVVDLGKMWDFWRPGLRQDQW